MYSISLISYFLTLGVEDDSHPLYLEVINLAITIYSSPFMEKNNTLLLCFDKGGQKLKILIS